MEQTVKQIGGKVLALALRAAIAEPTAAVLSFAAGTLVSELLDKTRSQEEKLNTLLTTPFLTGIANLRQVLASPSRTLGEHDEDERLLREAADKLQDAKNNQPDMYLVITAYQALVRALMKDSEKFMVGHLSELEQCVAASRRQAQALWDLASSIQGIRPYTRGEREGYEGVSKRAVRDELRKVQLQEEANRLERYAIDVSLVIDFVRSVAISRLEILNLRAEKRL